MNEPRHRREARKLSSLVRDTDRLSGKEHGRKRNPELGERHRERDAESRKCHGAELAGRKEPRKRATPENEYDDERNVHEVVALIEDVLDSEEDAPLRHPQHIRGPLGKLPAILTGCENACVLFP